MKIELAKNQKIYIASDQHFGIPNHRESLIREKHFISWLEEIKHDAGSIILLGDLFDFWFEYKTVVPKGFVRILGKLAELSDSGIPLYFFIGNHDLWMRDYFETELGIRVFSAPQRFTVGQHQLLMGHGDGLGPGDKGYKRMKKVFTNPVAKWFYRWLHPDWGVQLAKYLSTKNKLISGDEDVVFLGEDDEWLVQYCKQKLRTEHIDYFVFGHRHLPMTIPLNDRSTYINTGDWIGHYTYAVYDGDKMELTNYDKALINS